MPRCPPPRVALPPRLLCQPFKREAGRDPLDMNRRKAMLEVREDPQGSTYVPDLLTVKVRPLGDVVVGKVRLEWVQRACPYICIM